MNFSDPHANIQELKLREGMHVADIGAGSGFYAFAAARLIADGTVYAIDIQKDLLVKLKQEALHQHLGNIEIMWGDAEAPRGTKLRDGSVDAAIVSNILFQVEKKQAVFVEVKRILKPGGKMLVVDWSDSFNHLGPRPEDIVPVSVARTLITEGGFAIEREIFAGAHHYGIIAIRT